ncbi:GNAT family N-acetyltransferase [Streptomyces sp. NPDC093261]|uniref:GNAT family N-acetyltransferase n=1 Tax=Streptomyces sp. NPDC093261 TaxID=3366037 RepID=UPI0037FB0B2B
MTTTLRPTEPLRQHEDGTRSRHYLVCVNGRPVGALRLATHPEYGPTVARLEDLRIEEPDRGRGRGTVAALAAEEVVRGWGCARIEASVPGDAEAALRLMTALGYVPRSRNMAKSLGSGPPRLPAGSAARPMTEAEYGPWHARDQEGFVRDLVARGVTESQARIKAERNHTRFLPNGLATENILISVLEQEGNPVGTLWLGLWPETAFVLGVDVRPEQRRRGHGRTLMALAEAQAAGAGRDRMGLNVFAGNTPAERLYASLGYETTAYHLYKELI